jgi:flagellar protein FlaF
MQSPANAYGKVSKQISGPRELEADLLLQAAARLQAVQVSCSSTNPALHSALLYNRKLWTLFMTSVTDENSPLDKTIRQNVANLGLFVMKQTMAIQRPAAGTTRPADQHQSPDRRRPDGKRLTGSHRRILFELAEKPRPCRGF